MKIQVKKSGNSAALRIPTDILKSLDIAIGEELDMNVNRNGFSFKKIEKNTVRKGWFDGICPLSAKKEAEIMEKNFGEVQNAHLDEWDFGDEW